MNQPVMALAAGLAVCGLAGCPLFKNDDAKRDGAAATAGASAATTSAHAATTAGGPAGGALTPASLPAGRSAPPTLDEWAAMREVTVKGSSALSCETKMVREYLRISCRGKNDSGGTPTTVKVLRGGRGGINLFAASGVTSAVVPYVEGIDAALQFSWTDKSHTLTLKWPRGAPKPQVLGVFEGAKSPLDAVQTSAADQRLCDCHKKVTKTASCEAMLSVTNLDCDATYSGQCEALLACSRGEPDVPPKCRSGHVLGPFNACFKSCGAPDKTCPSETTCDKQYLGVPVCIPQ